jgi:hydrogenase expression/formation protein HypC
MCLAVPAKIVSLEDSGQGVASYMGSEVRANFTLVPQAKPGDWVILHAGFAISVVDDEEAKETLRLFKEMAELEG